MDIVDIEVIDSSRMSIIALIDQLIEAIKSQNEVTYDSILEATEVIEKRINLPGVESVIKNMGEGWKREQASLSIIERDLRIIRRILS
jgi:hypothetical protein